MSLRQEIVHPSPRGAVLEYPGIADLQEDGAVGLGEIDALVGPVIVAVSEIENRSCVQLVGEQQLREQPLGYGIDFIFVQSLISLNVYVL